MFSDIRKILDRAARITESEISTREFWGLTNGGIDTSNRYTLLYIFGLEFNSTTALREAAAVTVMSNKCRLVIRVVSKLPGDNRDCRRAIVHSTLGR